MLSTPRRTVLGLIYARLHPIETRGYRLYRLARQRNNDSHLVAIDFSTSAFVSCSDLLSGSSSCRSISVHQHADSPAPRPADCEFLTYRSRGGRQQQDFRTLRDPAALYTGRRYRRRLRNYPSATLLSGQWAVTLARRQEHGISECEAGVKERWRFPVRSSRMHGTWSMRRKKR